jgi:hypothetical protein
MSMPINNPKCKRLAGTAKAKSECADRSTDYRGVDCSAAQRAARRQQWPCEAPEGIHLFIHPTSVEPHPGPTRM